jgi:hypothetical protein
MLLMSREKKRNEENFSPIRYWQAFLRTLKNRHTDLRTSQKYRRYLSKTKKYYFLSMSLSTLSLSLYPKCFCFLLLWIYVIKYWINFDFIIKKYCIKTGNTLKSWQFTLLSLTLLKISVAYISQSPFKIWRFLKLTM